MGGDVKPMSDWAAHAGFTRDPDHREAHLGKKEHQNINRMYVFSEDIQFFEETQNGGLQKWDGPKFAASCPMMC